MQLGQTTTTSLQLKQNRRGLPRVFDQIPKITQVNFNAERFQQIFWQIFLTF